MNYWEQLSLYRIPYTLAQKLCLLEYGERETLSPLLVLADQPEPFYFLLLISAQIQKKKKFRAVSIHSVYKSFLLCK